MCLGRGRCERCLSSRPPAAWMTPAVGTVTAPRVRTLIRTCVWWPPRPRVTGCRRGSAQQTLPGRCYFWFCYCRPKLSPSWVSALTLANSVFSGKVSKYFLKLSFSYRNGKERPSCFVLLLTKLFRLPRKNKTVSEDPFCVKDTRRAVPHRKTEESPDDRSCTFPYAQHSAWP